MVHGARTMSRSFTQVPFSSCQATPVKFPETASPARVLGVAPPMAAPQQMRSRVYELEVLPRASPNAACCC